MGRKRTEIKMIENVSSRKVTFTKRRHSLMKKAKELAILCEAEIAVIVISSTAKIYDFSSSSMEQILSRYGYSSSSTQQNQREPQLLLCSSHENAATLWQKDDSMKKELARLELVIERLKGKALDGMSFSDLISLEIQLNESLHNVKDQKTQILLNQMERSQLQEKRALEENQILRKQVEMLGKVSGPKEIGENPENKNGSSSSDDDQNDSLQLGLSSSGYSTKRKKPKLELQCDNSGSQVV